MNTIKPNTKIKILSPEHSEYVQKLAFEQGFGWAISGKRVMYTEEHFLFFEAHSIVWTSSFDYFNRLAMKEIFIPLPNTKPKPPFKIRNANHPTIRKWLKDMGYTTTYSGDSIDVIDDNVEFILVKKDGSVVWWDAGSIGKGFKAEFAHELTLNLSVDSWYLPEPAEPDNPAKQERADRIKAIEAELEKLKAIEQLTNDEF